MRSIPQLPLPCFVAKHDDPRHLLAIRIRFLFMRSQVLQNYKIIYHLNKKRVSLAPERSCVYQRVLVHCCRTARHKTAQHVHAIARKAGTRVHAPSNLVPAKRIAPRW